MDDLKKYFDSRWGKAAKNCPDVQEILDWAEGRTSYAGRETLVSHTAECSSCLEKLTFIKECLSKPAHERQPSAALKKRVMEFIRAGEASRHGSVRRHTHLWFTLFLVFFTASFVIKPYFMQMLLLAAIAGGKWLLDTHRHHIFINVKQKLKPENEGKSRLFKPWERSKPAKPTKRAGRE